MSGGDLLKRFINSSNMTIRNYLQSLGEQLKLSPGETQKVLKEIEAHLVQETASLQKKGLSREKAEERACTEFGDPAVIAKGYQKMSSWFFRTSLRVVALTLVIMVIVNKIPGRLFFELIQLFDDPTNISFDVRWFGVFTFIPYVLFAISVFYIVQQLTFSRRRLLRLLIVTLLTIFFGEIVYAIITISIGMSIHAIDGDLILRLFIGQGMKIILMALIYLCLYFVVFKKSIHKIQQNEKRRGQG